LTVIAGSLVMASAGGCAGDGTPRHILTGAVTYAGQPVPEGSVLFIPSDGTRGPSIAAKILDGRYRADSLGGLPAGNYRVQILGYRESGGKATPQKPRVGPGASTDAPEQYLPEKYNVRTELKVKVEADARSTTQDFNLAE
jgi:hypothetical protein